MNPVYSCPDPKTLRQFQLGLLPEPEAELLGEHLETCNACVARLEAPPTGDTLLEALHAHETTPDHAPDPETVSGLIQRLKDLHPSLSRSASETPCEAATGEWPGEAPAVPARIGRYQLLGRLGAGGMGTVYKALDPDLDRQVAIKVPRFDGSPQAQGQARQRFLREARAAARVRHPHVCPIHDVGEHEDRPYVVMAFVEGQSLADHLRRHGRFDDCRRAVTLVRQVVEALAAVHEHGIVHRDLKPGNILLDRSGQALLTDFGLARLEGDAEHLTAPGVMPGTPAYMAPEQVDPHLGLSGITSDVYSLGVVLYQLLTGRLPFEGSPLTILRLIADQTPQPPSRFRTDLDPSLEAVLARAMARRPEQRYPSAAAFAEALARWLAGNSVTDPLTAGPPSAATLTYLGQGAATLTAPSTVVRGRSRFPWLAAAAGLAAVTVGTAAYFLLRPAADLPPDPPPDPGPAAQQPVRNPAAAALPPFKGFIDLRVWEPGNPRRFNVRLNDGPALPLKPKDQVRIFAELNRKAYLYVLLIDTTGKVSPIYPWKPGNWQVRPADERPRDRLDLPEGPSDNGWEVDEGPPGMETMVLLVRETPLPPTVDLKRLLGPLPAQRHQSTQAVVWFENGEVVRNETLRGFKSFDPTRIEDPVLQTQARLKERLLPHFAYMRAVSYANQVE
jgi:hypothetical protein